MNITSNLIPISRSDILCAPLIKFLEQENKKWKVSILIVSPSAGQKKFFCKEAQNIGYKLVFSIYQCVAEAFQLCIEQAAQGREVEYKVFDRTFSMFVPGKNDSIAMGFFTCNGFHSHEDDKNLGGIQKMWENYNTINANSRSHLLLFGGDQEYFDPVFELPSLKTWVNANLEEKIKIDFTPEMEKEVSNFYLEGYIKKFTLGSPLANALSGTPSIMNWDDHDIFDGWGSYYSKDLQNCPVFQGIFKFAKIYYLIFQQHLDPSDPFTDGSYFIGKLSFSILRKVDDLAILAVDTRSHRTRNQILPQDAWEEIFEACEELPPSCKHFFVILPVPIVYPDLNNITKLAKEGDKHLEFVKKAVDCFNSPKLKQLIISPINTVDLTDDFMDEWRYKEHQPERMMLINRLQDIAKRKTMRVTILTGDVHLGGIAELYNPMETEKKYDPHYMAEIISSPMGNIPAGNIFAMFLSHFDNKKEPLDEHTWGHLVPILREDGKNSKILISKRNWAQLVWDPQTQNIKVTLNVESKDPQKFIQTGTKAYAVTIPPLLKKPAAASIDGTYSEATSCKLF